jgi:hypothetical protein
MDHLNEITADFQTAVHLLNKPTCLICRGFLDLPPKLQHHTLLHVAVQLGSWGLCLPILRYANRMVVIPGCIQDVWVPPIAWSSLVPELCVPYRASGHCRASWWCRQWVHPQSSGSNWMPCDKRYSKHHAYSQDLSSCDFHIFTPFKKALRCTSGCDVQQAVV